MIRSIMHKAKAREEQAALQARREEIYWEMVWREKQAELQRVQSRAHRIIIICGSRSAKQERLLDQLSKIPAFS